MYKCLHISDSCIVPDDIGIAIPRFFFAGGIDRSVRIFHEPSSYWGNPIYKLVYNSNKLSLSYIYII